MSSYENYTRTSQQYDETRGPTGIGVILGCLALTGKRLHEMVIVDAGCGTGNYTQAALNHVAQIEAIDLNQGMLDMASAKLADAQATGRVRFHHGSITELPLDDRSVDGVMINQVMHHLGDHTVGGFPAHRTVIEEFYRVLRPGGAVVINTASQEQLRRAYWYLHLIPEALNQIAARFPSLDVLEAMLADAGFARGGRVVPVDEALFGDAILDPRKPLDPVWRDGDSSWSLATADELAQALERVRDMDARGTLEAYHARLDAPRRSIGQVTFLHATRPT